MQRELAGGAATTSGIDVTRQNINVNDASIEEARVRMENAKNDDERYAQLLKADAVPGEEYEGVATMYRLIFIESYLFDKTTHTSIYRSDMLLHGSIIGIFAIAKAHEMVYHQYYSNEEYYEHTNIIYCTECLRIFHLFILLLSWRQILQDAS